MRRFSVVLALVLLAAAPAASGAKVRTGPAGYAVIRTDYQGLGTPGIHEYLVGIAEGRSTLDIVRAAHRLDSRVSGRMAIAGHSQGGHAALWGAALAPRWTPELKLRGTVAF